MFILRFAKALVALSCSGGVFLYLKKLKLLIFLQPYFTILSHNTALFFSIDLYRYFKSSIFVYDLTPV